MVLHDSHNDANLKPRLDRVVVLALIMKLTLCLVPLYFSPYLRHTKVKPQNASENMWQMLLHVDRAATTMSAPSGSGDLQSTVHA